MGTGKLKSNVESKKNKVEKKLKIAIKLMYFSFILNIVFISVMSAIGVIILNSQNTIVIQSSPFSARVLLILGFIGIGFWIFEFIVIYKISKLKEWARIAYVVIFILLILALLGTFQTYINSASGFKLSVLISHGIIVVINLIAIKILFSHEVNVYFIINNNNNNRYF